MVIIREDDGLSYVCEAVEGGVMGFGIKTTGNEELAHNIQEIFQGRFLPQFVSFWSYSG
jgi:DNA-binding NarL/FixJ family response regulator